MAEARGYAGNALAAAADRAITINERLNKTAESLQYQCERLEGVLNRVNGTPQTIEKAARGQNAPSVTLPMSAAVEHLEQAVQRLCDLASGIERIA